MHGERVDGSDLHAVIEASGRLLARARVERRPAVLEAMTYRFRGHSVADAGLAYRTREEIAQQQAADPLVRVRDWLQDAGVGPDELTAVDRWADGEVDAAVEFAKAGDPPDVGELARGVHAPGSAEQFARMRAGAPCGEAELDFAGGLGR
jgi:pyruvate dehydrogenase E1 component alpha subunit